MATTVVHCKRAPYDQLIDRTTPYGNPFKIGRDGNRAEVISKYRAWVLKHPRLISKIRTELTGKVLGCWCKPNACHGDVIVELCDENTHSLPGRASA